MKADERLRRRQDQAATAVVCDIPQRTMEVAGVGSIIAPFPSTKGGTHMFHRFRTRLLLPLVLVGALIAAAVAAAPAVAAHGKMVRCIGNANFCGATVSIAGGASNRVVKIKLTDTDFKLVAVRVVPKTSKGAFSISKASFRHGGSQYRFTLSAVAANPPGAKIILLFAAGVNA